MRFGPPFHAQRIKYYVSKTNSKGDQNYAFAFPYLFFQICNVMTAYFGKISEENIKNNFVLIYELLDGKHGCHKLLKMYALVFYNLH